MTIAIITEAGVRKVAPLVVVAQQAAAAAQLYAQVASAAAQGRIYPDYSTGNAATVTGQYFFVAFAGEYDLYVHGTATPVAKLPTLDLATGQLRVLADAHVGDSTAPTNTAGFDRQLQITGAVPCLSLNGTTGARKFSLGVNSNGNLAFWDNNAAGYTMMISTSGNLGVGPMTGPAPVRLHVMSTAEIARFETTTARGGGNGSISVRDPTGRKAYFAYAGLDDTFYQVNEMNADMVFGTNGTNRWIITSAGHLITQADNAYSLGDATHRPTVLWAVTGTISTSDEREKTWRGAPTAGELQAAKRIVAELGFFQWNDAIAEKGPELARLHFGVRAQRVWEIMADEGLISPLVEGVTPDSKYAFLCWDQWDAIEGVAPVEEVADDEGNVIVEARPGILGRPSGDRFGVRVDHLSLFLIAAQEARLAAIEAAL